MCIDYVLLWALCEPPSILQHMRSPVHRQFATAPTNYVNLDILLDQIKRPRLQPSPSVSAHEADHGVMIVPRNPIPRTVLEQVRLNEERLVRKRRSEYEREGE